MIPAPSVAEATAKVGVQPAAGIRPQVSVLIVAFRSREHLANCLPSLLSQGLPSLEIIVVDNSPGDGTREWLEDHYPRVRVITSQRNGGYAGGNNLGLAAARGDFVLVLNPDTELRAGALAALLKTVGSHPRALVTAKLLRSGGDVNACGLEMHYTGVTSCRGLGAAASDYSELHPVPLVSGSAFIARRQDLDELGGFDDNFFMYFEDVDLSLRARLLGYEVLCAPEAVITHHYRLAMTPRKFYFLQRNRLQMLAKIYRKRTWLRLLPAMLLTEFATCFYALTKGPAYVTNFFAAYHWLWSYRHVWLEQRTAVQESRVVGDEAVLRLGLYSLPFAQLTAKGGLARLLDNAIQPLFRALALAPDTRSK